jgi:hypothetical protein
MEISKPSDPFIFALELGKYHNGWDVCKLAMFMLMGTAEKPTLRSYY